MLDKGTLRVYWAFAAPMNVTEMESVLDWGVGRALAAVRQVAAVRIVESFILDVVLELEMSADGLMGDGFDERRARLYIQETWRYVPRQRGKTS